MAESQLLRKYKRKQERAYREEPERERESFKNKHKQNLKSTSLVLQ